MLVVGFILGGCVGLAVGLDLWPHMTQTIERHNSYVRTPLNASMLSFDIMYESPHWLSSDTPAQLGLIVKNTYNITNTSPAAPYVSASASGDVCDVTPSTLVSRHIPPPQETTRYSWNLSTKAWFGSCRVSYAVDFNGFGDRYGQYSAEVYVAPPVSVMQALGVLIVTIAGLGIIPAMINYRALVDAARINSGNVPSQRLPWH